MLTPRRSRSTSVTAPPTWAITIAFTIAARSSPLGSTRTSGFDA
jgi:hypothetical protein